MSCQPSETDAQPETVSCWNGRPRPGRGDTDGNLDLGKESRRGTTLRLPIGGGRCPRPWRVMGEPLSAATRRVVAVCVEQIRRATNASAHPEAPLTGAGRTNRARSANPSAPPAAAGGGEEGVDHLALAGQVRVGDGGCSPYPAAGPAGELPGGLRRAADHPGAISSNGTANMSCSTNANKSVTWLPKRRRASFAFFGRRATTAPTRWPGAAGVPRPRRGR
jgi:hypothetical protein